MLSTFFNTYNLQARLLPLLIVLIPVILLAIYFGVYGNIISIGFSSLFCLSYGIFLTTLTRPYGKSVESRLFPSKDKLPSVVFLTTNQAFNSNQLKRIKDNFNKEFDTPYKYGSKDFWINVSETIRGSRRDLKKYPLVFEENCNYGFRRNLLGVKNIALLIAIISLVVILFNISFLRSINEIGVFTIIFILFDIMIIVSKVNDTYVIDAANEYAKRLIETLL